MSGVHKPFADGAEVQAHPDVVAVDNPVVDAAAGQGGHTSGAAQRADERRAVVVVAVPPRTSTSQPHTTTPSSGSAQRDVRVASNLRDLVTAMPVTTAREAQVAKERRDLNDVVHAVLIVGLIISTALMLVGVGLYLFSQRDLPTTVPEIGDVIRRVRALRPSGFLALGLLVLIATPIVRVIGSIGAFVYERDWRFASLTTLVLLVLVVSLVLGHG